MKSWIDHIRKCEQCGNDGGRYALCDSCHSEWQQKEIEMPYFKEVGAENPLDSKGSTAHIRDIKDRRWHPTEKRLFYYSKEPSRTYFVSKGH